LPSALSGLDTTILSINSWTISGVNSVSRVTFLTTYKQTRPVAVEYRRAADKARFRQEHESALILYEAAGRALREGGVTKLPDLAALKAEYARLSEEKERLYAKYGEVKKELKEYGIIKQNVDGILRVTPRQQERKQEL